MRAGGQPVTRARERVSVLAFALTLLALLVGGAFVLGYIVGKLVL